jgi:uncharacterized protein YdhG (YjbR/CyaY superfamily)
MRTKAEVKSAPTSVDNYLAEVPTEARATLEKLRQTIKAVVPTAVEVISYQIPTFKLDGRMLVSYAAFKDHCSFFPGAAPIKAHEDELKSYQTSKGTIRFPTSKPLPATLVRKLVKTRIKENEARAKR